MNSFVKVGLLAATLSAGAAVLYADPASLGLGGDPSAQSRVAHVQMLRQQGAEDMHHVMHLRDSARRAKDIIRLTCVNDKLVQMQPLMNTIDHLQIEVETNASVMTEAGATADSVRHLREEADGCGGEALLSGNESTNGFTAPTIPDTPYGEPWNVSSTIIEPPGYASPFD
jgi:hypothetical protein